MSAKDRGVHTPQSAAEAKVGGPATFDTARLPWQVTRSRPITLEVVSYRAPGANLPKTCLVGSVVDTNTAFSGPYGELPADDKARALDKVNQAASAFLQGDLTVRRAGLMTSSRRDDPNIHVLNTGQKGDPKALTVYYTHVHGDRDTFLLVAACRSKDERRVERAIPNYTSKKN